MPLFPKITSPCPYLGRLDEMMDGDFCRTCQRQVFDLSGFSDGERRVFLAACESEVCVSYRLPVRGAMAAASLAASVMGLPALAHAEPTGGDPQVESPASAEVTYIVITGGGIADPANAEFVELGDAPPAPDLPIIYEDEASADLSRPDADEPPASPATR